MAAPQSAWFCSDVSRESGESLTGTAPRTDVWLMVEYSGAWGKKALEASAIPPAVKDHLATAEKSIPNARVELVRQDGRRSQGDLTFFVARSSEPAPALYRFTVGSYDDILALDLAAIAGGDPRFDANRLSSAVYLVCTHGRRDECCARNGLPIYHLMAGRAKDAVWQCSHLGGHRLGANVVVLPHGLLYGRVTAGDIAAILNPERIHLANFRGRTCFDGPAQAAETFLREHLNVTELAGLVLSEMDETGEARWDVRFRSGGGETSYRVRIEQIPADFGTYSNCGDENLTGVKHFRLIDIS